MHILLTNDDGIGAEGLEALRAALGDLGEVTVVAPDREQSGASHALTLHRPLRMRRVADRVYRVDGTPTDCVLLAVRGLKGVFRERPDLVVSGINHGTNLGDDVTYSGTVAAAMEASLFGIPAIAFSQAWGDPQHWATAATVARRVVDRFTRSLGGGPILLNVNIPNLPIEQLRGTRVARLGRRTYPGSILERKDPHGRPYYWIGDSTPVWDPAPDTDESALRDGFVTLTPLQMDLTDHERMAHLDALDLDLNAEE